MGPAFFACHVWKRHANNRPLETIAQVNLHDDKWTKSSLVEELGYRFFPEPEYPHIGELFAKPTEFAIAAECDFL